MSDELNPAQKIALEVELRHLEQHLLHVRALMHTTQDGILTHYHPLPPEVAQRLEPLIDEILAVIAGLVARFELRPRIEDVGRYVNAVTADAWSGLYDVMPKGLRGYGAVNPALEESLTPALQHLIRLARQASVVVGHQE